MPMNPERASRGGDVEGTTKTDPGMGVGSPVTVADASYEPGYEIGAAMDDISLADVKAGYCSYGVSVGDRRGKDYIGGSK